MPRYALLIAYHGGGFAGWAPQPGQRSVAGELAAALARLGDPAQPVGASRTDAGVHALGQVAHVDLARPWEPARLRLALARHCPPDLAVRAVARVPEGWDARRGVRWKRYRYTLDLGAPPDPFLHDRAWAVGGLDLQRLAAAAALAAGARDWRSFARRGEQRADTRCMLHACRWRRLGRRLVIDLVADAFIYRLARALVGGLVQVARGAIALDEWRRGLAGERVGAARQQAPARGLCLARIRYRDPPAWDAQAAQPPAGMPP